MSGPHIKQKLRVKIKSVKQHNIITSGRIVNNDSAFTLKIQKEFNLRLKTSFYEKSSDCKVWKK